MHETAKIRRYDGTRYGKEVYDLDSPRFGFIGGSRPKSGAPYAPGTIVRVEMTATGRFMRILGLADEDITYRDSAPAKDDRHITGGVWRGDRGLD